MSLQVWIPFTDGTLKQQGVNNSAVSSGGKISLTGDGKLGKCVTFTSTAGGLTIPPSTMTSFTTECSVSFWLKINGWGSSYDTYFQAGTGSTPWAAYIFGFLRNGSGSTICFTIGNSSSASNNSYVTSTMSTGVWYHVALTYETGKVRIYLNGSLDKEYTTSIVPAFNKITKISIGRSNSDSSYQTQCSMNDLRIYDNCLSAQEVKEISRGLVLHYPLDRRGLGPSNLLKNGFGELGSENWDSSTTISTSDIPSGQSDIKASFSNGHAIEHIKLYSTHTYKFSTWIKATATSGNTYPSLFPYDVDGKFINNYNCPDGFNLNTMTTLKQQLKPGDTKIYVNDLSQWNANSGHYYNWAAIFSYTDGAGQTYPDGTYTQNMGRFGSSTNAKTNLDKTNNTITLLSAYTGPAMPVGTKVCASTEGSTYFYPWGGFNLANIQDWTYKESTVSGNHNRLKYSKYVTFWTYSSNRMAGIKIVDLTNEGMDSTTEYDCSGFCNNGTRTGTFSWTSDSPKYQISTQFDTTSTKVKLPAMSFTGMANSYTFAWWQYNVSIGNMPWGFSDGNRLNCYHTSPLCWNTGDGSSNQFKNGSATIAPSTVQNGWHHMVVTGDGTSTKLYIDGEYKGTATTYKALTGTQIYISGWDTGTSYTFNGSKECDFRIYATALSANDVLSLYNNGAYIDSAGNIHGKIR